MVTHLPKTSGLNLALFEVTCPYATERKEGYVLRNIQLGLDSMAAWYKRWNIKINEDKTQTFYFTCEIDRLILFLS
jgi:hypothetical protein